MKRKIATLFNELCCSQCRADFDEDSVVIMREEDEMIVIKMVCQHCQKSFGVAFLGISDITLKDCEDGKISNADLSLKVSNGLHPINEDEVLDAHKFIKDFDKNWHKFMDKLDN